MTNKQLVIKNLKTREAEINEELEYKNTDRSCVIPLIY